MKTLDRYTSSIVSLSFALVCIIGMSTQTTHAKSLVDDNYENVKHPTRKAIRGGWKIENGSATVEQDDALYKKHKNHGPIMVYSVPHTNAASVVEFKPTDCKTVVFTMDAAEGGHAFRVKLRTESKKKGKGKGKKSPSSQIVTYAAKGDKPKAEQIVLSSDVPKLINDDWNRIEIRVEGSKASVKINGEEISVAHDRISQTKKIAKLGFSFGKLSIRKFTLESID